MWIKAVRRILRWFLLGILILLGIGFAGVIFIQTSFSDFVQDYVQTELGWSLKIGSAEIKFRPLSVRLNSIEISAGGRKPFLRARSAFAQIPYSSFWKNEFLVHVVILDAPAMNLENIPPQKKSKQTAESEMKPFRIEAISVREGELQFKDNHLKQINITAGMDAGGLRINRLVSKLNHIDIEIQGDLEKWDKPSLDFTYKIAGDASQIASMFPAAGTFKGIFLTTGSLKGPLSSPVLLGTVESEKMSVDGSTSFSFKSNFNYDFANSTHPVSIKTTFHSVPLELLKKFRTDVPVIASNGRGTFIYSGNTDLWDGQGEIHLILEPKGQKGLPVSGNLDARLENGRIQIAESEFNLGRSRLIANGNLSRNHLSLQTDFESSRLSDISFFQPKLATIPGTVKVHAEMNGPFNDIRVQAELSGKSGTTIIEASGETRTGTKSFALEFQGSADSNSVSKFVPELHAGQFQFQGSAKGTWNKPQLNATLNGQGLQYGEISIQQISSQVETKGNEIQFHANAPELPLQIEGVYWLNTGKYEIRGAADGISAKTLVTSHADESLPLSGSIYANFEAAGNLRRWKDSTAVVHLRSNDLQYNHLLVNIPEAEIRLENKVAHLKIIAIAENGQLNVSGTTQLVTGFPLDLQITGNFAGEALEKISPGMIAKGELGIEAFIQGKAMDPKVQGKVRTQNFQIDYPAKQWSFFLETAEIALSEQVLITSGSGKFNDSPFLWNGNLPMKEEAANIHLEIAQFPLSTLQTGANVTGNLNVVGDLKGKGFALTELKDKKMSEFFQDWSGNVSITSSELMLGNNPVTVDAPVLIAIQNRQVELAPVKIRSGDLLNFLASGKLDLKTGKIESNARLEAKIDLLSNVKTDIQSSGPLTADLHLGGTLQQPEYSGSIQLTGASLRIPDSPLWLEELDLIARVDNKRVLLEKLQARSGGGVITGGGELIRGAKGSELWLQGKNVAANYPEGLRSQMDFDLKLTARESDYLLSGDVQVLRSLYEEELTLKNPIIRKLMAATSELTAEKQLRNKLKLAVNIRTIQDLQLKNNLAVLRAGGNLKLEGSLYRPRLIGGLNIREGSRLFLLGNQYDVEKASIEFYGSELIEPNLDITLSTLLRDFQTDTYYEVFIPFGGTLSNLEFKNVRSNPSLSQDQIFSLISQGTVESETAGSGAAAFQRQILSALAGQALGAPSAAIAKSIGLSRIQVQQEGLSSVNDPKTRLMLGKDIGSGFSLIYSFVLNDPQDQTWIATYRYGRNIIGRFIDQDDNSYTVSVSHKIPFGPGQAQSAFPFGRKKDRGIRVSSIEWKNDSSIPDSRVQEIMKLEVGDRYDYWTSQDRADELKKELQKLGYLFAVVDIRDKQSGKDQAALSIVVSPGERSQMIFHGYDVDDKLLSQYRKMWRSGVSVAVVQQMIREDLLRQIQKEGYYKAAVISRTEKTSDQTIYYFDATPGIRYSSVEIQFQGTEHYDPATLQSNLRMLYRSSSDLFREAVHESSDFVEKIKLLYVQQGYLKTSIEPGAIQYFDETGRIVRTIHISEGVPSQIDAMMASSGISFPEPLIAQLQLKQGEPFLPDALLEDELKIRGFYESEGYQHVSIEYKVEFVEKSPDLLLTWALQTGPVARVASIRIEGNQSTRTDLIRNQIGLNEGDVLTPYNQSLARKQLSDLGVFHQIALETSETGEAGQYDVIVRVVENKKYEFQYGGRYNTDDKLGAEIRLSDFNFLGRAHNLSFYIRSTLDLPLFRVDYILPVTGSFWDRTRFSVFRDETDEDVRATIDGDVVRIPFVQRQLTAQFQQDRRLWNLYRLLYGFEYGEVGVDFVDLETSAPITFDGTFAIFRATFLAEKRDDPLNATQGYFYSVDGEFAPEILGTNVTYYKNFSQGFYYRRLGRIVSATGIRAGFLSIRSNVLTIAEKFRTGGSTTLRGFEHNTVVPDEDLLSIFFGGDSVLILNQEIRFPIYKWFSGATFFDAGNVYRTVSDFDPAQLRYSAGFGVRAGAAGFIIRFDFGFNLDPEEDEPRSVLHFGIGQAF